MTTAIVKQKIDHAPTGKGLRISPATVVMKIASNCHALVVTCFGLGTAKRIIMPIDIEATKGMNLAPCQDSMSDPAGGGGGGDGGGGGGNEQCRGESDDEEGMDICKELADADDDRILPLP